ncbi:MAG: hypothetical protein ACXWYQ_08840 [Actinomycetota bacterium]
MEGDSALLELKAALRTMDATPRTVVHPPPVVVREPSTVELHIPQSFSPVAERARAETEQRRLDEARTTERAAARLEWQAAQREERRGTKTEEPSGPTPWWRRRSR